MVKCLRSSMGAPKSFVSEHHVWARTTARTSVRQDIAPSQPHQPGLRRTGHRGDRLAEQPQRQPGQSRPGQQSARPLPHSNLDHQRHPGTVLTLDGTSGEATSGAQVLDPTSSSSVSAWVNLASLPTHSVTVAAQDGAEDSAFVLKYDYL